MQAFHVDIYPFLSDSTCKLIKSHLITGYVHFNSIHFVSVFVSMYNQKLFQ